MKVVMYAAATINGYIARENYQEDFISNYDLNVFLKITNKFKCLIIGRKSYDVMTNSEDYDLNKFKKIKIIVISKKNFDDFNNFYFVKSPKGAINQAKKLGFNKVLLAGGGKTNSSFMKLNLIDEIIINLLPFALSKGIKMFGESDFENKLKLLKIEKLKYRGIKLHYKVIKWKY